MARKRDKPDKVGLEILEYLEAHPEAADTLDGILQWWLPRQRYEKTREALERALLRLSDEGLIDRLQVTNGHVVYRRRTKTR